MSTSNCNHSLNIVDYFGNYGLDVEAYLEDATLTIFASESEYSDQCVVRIDFAYCPLCGKKIHNVTNEPEIGDYLI